MTTNDPIRLPDIIDRRVQTETRFRTLRDTGLRHQLADGQIVALYIAKEDGHQEWREVPS